MAEGDQQTSEALALVLKDLALRMERLKQLYEQYFMGIERMEPLVARKEVTRAMIGLQQTYIRNTALRFKFNTMLQKWNLYLTYWTRTLREIEKGTYVRHIQKAARAAERKGSVLPTEMKRQLGKVEPEEAPERTEPNIAQAAPVPPPLRTAPPIPGSAAKAPPPIPGAKAPPPIPGTKAPPPIPGARPSAPPVVAAPLPPRPIAAASSTVPGMNESDLRALHKKYVDARTASGDSAPVRYESLVASLAKQVPKLLEQPGVRGVSFDVSMKDGKAILKATPRK
ncbi:MAG: MXAN_5187 C-terminal domain-containing protein [Polyangia bacterium]